MSKIIEKLKNFTWTYGKTTAQYINHDVPTILKFGEEGTNCFRSMHAIRQHIITSHMFLVNIKSMKILVEYHKKAKIISVEFPKGFVGNDEFFRAYANVICLFLESLQTVLDIDWEKTRLAPRFLIKIYKKGDKVYIDRLKPYKQLTMLPFDHAFLQH